LVAAAQHGRGASDAPRPAAPSAALAPSTPAASPPSASSAAASPAAAPGACAPTPSLRAHVGRPVTIHNNLGGAGPWRDGPQVLRFGAVSWVTMRVPTEELAASLQHFLPGAQLGSEISLYLPTSPYITHISHVSR